MKILMTFILLVVCVVSVEAREIEFKNGDTISATVISETDSTITVNSDLFGQLTFDKSLIVTKDAQKPKPKKFAWKNKVSLGYAQSGGNTEKSNFSGKVSVEKTTDDKEYSGKYSAYVASSDGNQDARKFKSTIRYANKFGDNKQWYNFYKVEGDQDRFSNIEYRFIPSAGYGYWFYNRDDFKLRAEAAVGWQYTNYVDNTDSESEMVIVPQGYFEKQISDTLTFSEELTLYPSMSDIAHIRMTSETNLTGKLTDKTSWKVSFIDDYDSEPKGTTEKNDYQLITSLEYSF